MTPHLGRPGAASRAAGWAAAAAMLLCVSGTAVALRRTVPAVAWELPLWQWRAPAVPADPNGLLAGLLARELPRGFCVVNQPSLPARMNIALVAEWLPVREPSLPIGDACDPATLVPVSRDRPR